MQSIKKKGYAAKDHQEQGIVTIANKVAAALAEYKQYFLIAAAAAAVVVVIVAGYSFYRFGQEQKAAPLVVAAMDYYVPSAGSNADYQKALTLFIDAQNKYARTKSGAIAQYYIGNCLVSLGKPEDALNAYWSFTNKYAGEKFLLGLVYQRMGYVYSMVGKQADAVKAFEQAEAVGGPGVATIELAHLYEASGNIPEAQKKYMLAMERLGGTMWATEAMGKVQAIVPPMQPPAGPAGK